MGSGVEKVRGFLVRCCSFRLRNRLAFAGKPEGLNEFDGLNRLKWFIIALNHEFMPTIFIFVGLRFMFFAKDQNRFTFMWLKAKES